MLNIYVDADGCPVKDDVYRVSSRTKLKVFVVANTRMKVPLDPSIEMVVVSSQRLDAADDWIVDHVEPNDIVITVDILLADRCIKKGARALGHKGHEWTEDNIGDAVANRELMAHLRQIGEASGGPRPMTPKDRSLFLQTLDQIIQSIRRKTK